MQQVQGEGRVLNVSLFVGSHQLNKPAPSNLRIRVMLGALMRTLKKHFFSLIL